eukprot:7225618-Prymnesium_polylepis.1
MQQSHVDASSLRLLQLILGLMLTWHYIACMWWFIGDEYGRTQTERLLVLGTNIDTNHTYGVGMEYLAAYYWAIFMTTGLNCPIGPRDLPLLIMYEGFVCFIGICLQAYMLGAAANEIAALDASAVGKRQKLNRIKQTLRYLRAPQFLRGPIVEYYEHMIEHDQMGEAQDVLADMPSSLKVQLAVVLKAEHLKRVPFFAFLEPRIIAVLAFVLRSRVYLPGENILVQGDLGTALYFIRSGQAEVVLLKSTSIDDKLSDNSPSTGSQGSLSENSQGSGEQGEDGQVMSKLEENSCFGEQSFFLHMPAKATVRALSYAEMMILDYSDFESVCELYPALRVHML